MADDDSAAFKRFFDLYYSRLYRLAFYYVKSDVLSEELVSDVFMKIWNCRKRLPEIAQPDFYFFQSVKNQAITYLTRENKLNHTDYQPYKSSYIEYSQPENLLIARELAAKIEEAISQLPTKCEMIFRMVREEGMRYQEVAQLLDIAPKTVENQMRIALHKLKVVLEEYQQAEAVPTYVSLWYILVVLELMN